MSDAPSNSQPDAKQQVVEAWWRRSLHWLKEGASQGARVASTSVLFSGLISALIAGTSGWFIGQAQERTKALETLRMDFISDYFSAKSNLGQDAFAAAANTFQSRLRATLLASDESARILAAAGKLGCARTARSLDELAGMVDRCRDIFPALVNAYRVDLGLRQLPPQTVIDALAVSDMIAALAPTKPKSDAPSNPAPPVPGPASSYLLFYDFHSSGFADEALRIIFQAASTFKAGAFSHVVITGHTDTGEAAEGDSVSLSMKRATDVRDILVANGVPATAIYLGARGSTAPLVATGEGVREPQNRRTEIVFWK